MHNIQLLKDEFINDIPEHWKDSSMIKGGNHDASWWTENLSSIINAVVIATPIISLCFSMVIVNFYFFIDIEDPKLTEESFMHYSRAIYQLWMSFNLIPVVYEIDIVLRHTKLLRIVNLAISVLF